MEILLYFVAYWIILILCAILFKLYGNTDNNSVIFLAVIWPISLPIIIGSAIIYILIIAPIEFILKKIK